MSSNFGSVAPSDSVSNAPPPSTHLTVPTVAPVSGSRGRGGRGGRGRGRGGPRPPPSDGIPRPQHLTTVATPLRDDPILIDEFSVAGADSMTPTSFRPNMKLDHSGFPDLINTVYSQIVLSDRQFENRVPRPLFSYYCMVALWFRYIYLSVAFSRQEVDNVVLLQRYRSHEWYLPEPIKRYLDGIGEFRTPSGDKFQPASPTWPQVAPIANLPGSFGQVGNNTADLYRSYPTPAVYIYNVFAAMARQLGIAAGFGDLPPGLAPVAPVGQVLVPTSSLNGFDQNVFLSQKQVSGLRNLGFTINNNGAFGFLADRLGYNGVAVSFVSQAIQELNDFKVSLFQNSTPLGSLSCAAYLIHDDNDTPDYSGSSFCVNSVMNLDSRLSSGSLLMAYRIQHSLTNIDNGHGESILVDLSSPYNVFDQNGVRQPSLPQWNATTNRIFTFGQANRLNSSWFSTNYTPRLDNLAEMTRAFYKGKTGG